jgi:ABC-2 type transport system permease protein
MIPAWPALRGICAYEFRMQLRRRAVWVAVAVPTILLLAISLSGWPQLAGPLPPLPLAAFLTIAASQILPIVFGILLADRTPRERRLRTGELLDSLPAGLGARLWGKYLGATIATVIPVFLGYLLIVAIMAIRYGTPAAIPAVLPVFAIVALPGLLFVGAFSIVCTEILPTPLYAILFFGYWVWGNLLPPNEPPNPGCTPLTPIGRYPALHFFDQDPDPGRTCHLTQQDIGTAAALGSIALLLACAALALALTHRYLLWQAARR